MEIARCRDRGYGDRGWRSGLDWGEAMGMKGAVLSVCCLAISLAGCGQRSGPKPGPVAEKGVPAIVEALQAEAKAKSVNGVEITLAPNPEVSNDLGLVTARKVRGATTIRYTLEFKKGPNGWACTKAIANEESPGNRIDNQLNSDAIEMPQLLKWLTW